MKFLKFEGIAVTLLMIMAICILLLNCETKDPVPPPTIASVSAESGIAGTTITITGTNFSENLTSVEVYFNDIPAVVSAATSTSITVTVPTGATSGKISVVINGVKVESTFDFTVLTGGTITSFSPSFGSVGTTVTITGTNFGIQPGLNTVKFNGTTASVSAATATQLTVTVPAGATSGKISVSVNSITTSSTNDFLVGCPDLTITSVTVSNVVGNTFDISYDMKNVGTVSMDLTHIYLQAYTSTTSTSSGNLQGAGGFGEFGSSELLLQPNETRTKTASISSNAVNITTHPYVILQLLSNVQAPSVECSTTNNEASKLIALDFPRNGLIAFYPFNGNANDESGNGLNGTPTNGPVLTADRFGGSNKAYNFDGSNDYILVGNPVALQFNTKLTVACWVNISAFKTTSNQMMSILTKIFFDPNAGGNPTRGYQVAHDFTGSNDPVFSVAGWGTAGLNMSNLVGTTVSTANWIFVTLTIDDKTFKFYQNGTKTHEATGSNTILDDNSKGDLLIGAYNGNFNFNGAIDDVMIYNRALTSDEITKVLNQTVTKF